MSNRRPDSDVGETAMAQVALPFFLCLSKPPCREFRGGTAILRMLLLPYKINIFAVELSDVRVHPENQGRRKATMSAKEIKDEIQRLNPTDKIEVYRWVSKQLHVADLLAGVAVYRCFCNPLKTAPKPRVIS